MAEAVAESPGNLLANPGFEAGREGWSYATDSEFWKDFEIVESGARTGDGAAYLRLERDGSSPPKRVEVHGVVQELRPEPFPERLGGWYRVQRWEKDSERTALYLQVVVVVMEGGSNYQIRYYLAGAPERAISVSNAKVEIVSGDPPRQGAWVQFDLPIRRDFERLWGVVPSDYDSVRFLFEARWDKLRRDAEPALTATVYYDDLSVLAYDDAIDR